MLACIPQLAGPGSLEPVGRAEAIAAALGVPFREMFPDMYTRGRHDGVDSSSNKSGGGRPKRHANADGAQTAA